jgi:5-methyltetrahydrofolate--homocysteine methyltransferase
MREVLEIRADGTATRTYTFDMDGTEAVLHADCKFESSTLSGSGISGNYTSTYYTFPKGKPNNFNPTPALADFIAPRASERIDDLGGFTVTAGPEVETRAHAFKAANDDYNAIMTQALGDRLAEALAEMFHKRSREFCGYGRTENLSHEDLIRERYRGIRPAPGYPACPDHTEKPILFKLLDATAATGVTLTESCAMYPASSVSGWYFNHPDSKYFGVTRIGRDQIEDYAARKGFTVAETERWLGPYLDYTPEA